MSFCSHRLCVLWFSYCPVAILRDEGVVGTEPVRQRKLSCVMSPPCRVKIFVPLAQLDASMPLRLRNIGRAVGLLPSMSPAALLTLADLARWACIQKHHEPPNTTDMSLSFLSPARLSRETFP